MYNTSVSIIGAINIAAKERATTTLYNTMVAAGFTSGVLATTYAMAHVMSWSDFLQSALARQNNNYAGILWINYENSSKGTTAGGRTYARFTDLQAFCRYFLKVLNIDSGKGKPTQAATAQQYIDRLAKNRFFAPINLTSFNAALRDIGDILRKQAATAYQYKQQSSNTSNILQTVYNDAAKVLQAVTAVGIPQPAASFVCYQAYHESAAFKDYKFLQYNNPTGIKFAGQPGARAGNNNYAIFNSLNDWAKSIKHELQKGAQPPIKATTLEDYAFRLKTNGYYEDSYSNYFSGLQRARLVLKVIPAEIRADGTKDMDIPGSVPTKSGDWLRNMEAWAKDNPLQAGFAVIGIVWGVKKIVE